MGLAQRIVWGSPNIPAGRGAVKSALSFLKQCLVLQGEIKSGEGAAAVVERVSLSQTLQNVRPPGFTSQGQLELDHGDCALRL